MILSKNASIYNFGRLVMFSMQSAFEDQKEPSYGVQLIASLVKRLIQGTFQRRFEPKYFQNLLDEYVFRFNRRHLQYIGKKFMRIVQQVVVSLKLKWNEIKWDIDPISSFLSLELSG
jgi:hypothetical protein